jgi:hypothetical protein
MTTMDMPERMDFGDDDINQMNEVLRKMGLEHLQFQKDLMEEVKATDETLSEMLEEDESIQQVPPEEFEKYPTDLSFGAVLGVRLGQFIRAAWLAGRPSDKDVPPQAMIQLVGTYLASQRGEGLQ